jgi:hypothetical protein
MLVRTLALTLAATGLMVPVGAAPASAAPDNYSPRVGATFNNPVGGSDKKRAIFRKIQRSVNSSPRGSQINIFSWNFLTSEGADALLRAHRRDVRVRLLMDDRNVKQVDNPPFRRLRAGLRKGDRREKPRNKSYARLCQKTCRGGGGSAHSKFFMFSHAGKARKVVIQGSANYTVASTTNQWNDIYTHRGNRKVWDFANRIFKEAAADKRARRPYADREFGAFRLMMFPNTGRRVADPVMQMLNRVKCQGATNTASGRTRIRIAPDVIRNPRGMKLGRKVRALWRNGCDIRVGYTVIGRDVGRMMRAPSRRGPVPLKHLVQDFNGDGEFDNYFHMKSMTIVGNYGGDRSNHVLLNGSSNWSGLGKVSDENLGIYRSKGLVQRYQKHLIYWYKNFPGSRSTRLTTLRTGQPALEDQLIFGSGENAVYEDGTPVGYDPFVNMPSD